MAMVTWYILKTSAVCSLHLLLVCSLHFILSLHFTPGLQSRIGMQSALCILHWLLFWCHFFWSIGVKTMEKCAARAWQLVRSLFFWLKPIVTSKISLQMPQLTFQNSTVSVYWKSPEFLKFSKVSLRCVTCYLLRRCVTGYVIFVAYSLIDHSSWPMSARFLSVIVK